MAVPVSVAAEGGRTVVNVMGALAKALDVIWLELSGGILSNVVTQDEHPLLENKSRAMRKKVRTKVRAGQCLWG
jgi:hypothetical protein